MKTTLRKQIKKDLVDLAKEIDFVVIRSYEFLFNVKETGQRDLDLFVANFSEKGHQLLSKRGYFVVEKNKYRLKYAKYFRAEEEIFFLDFHKKTLTGYPISYKIGGPLLDNKKLKQGLPIPRSEDYLAALLLREILAEGFKSKYKKKLTELYSICNVKELYRLLSSTVSKNSAKKIIVYLKRGDFESLDKLRSKIKLKFVISNLGPYIKSLFCFKRRKSKVVALIGMDGSGKTTIVKKCVSILNKNGIATRYVYLGRGRSNILPVRKPAHIVKKAGSSSPKSVKMLIYSAGAFVYTFDFMLRHTLTKSRRPAILLSDRFSSDILLMENVPKVVRKFLYMLLPKADSHIYLYNDTSTLFKRGGHDKKDLARQEKEFLWVNKMLESKKIKNSKLGDSIEQVLELVLGLKS